MAPVRQVAVRHGRVKHYGQEWGTHFRGRMVAWGEAARGRPGTFLARTRQLTSQAWEGTTHMFTSTSVLRACTRTGARILASGALAVGLLATAPVADAHSATAGKSAQPAKHQADRKAKPKPKRKPSRIAVAMRTAVAQKGDPYVYGGAGPNRFDCSGLTYYSFRRAGFAGIPRTSAAQAGFARHIPRTAMRRGDLIFFTGGGGVYHVGVFAGWSHGRRMVLHAPYSGTRVRTDPVWSNSWFAGTLRHRA